MVWLIQNSHLRGFPMRFRFLSILFLTLLAVTQIAAAEDSIGKRVEVAEDRFEKAAQRVVEGLETAIDKKIQQAQRSGNLDLLTELKKQKQMYLEHEKTPSHPALSGDIRNYYRDIDREGDKLVKIYEHAIKEYTKAGGIEAAKAIQERIAWLRPMSHVTSKDGAMSAEQAAEMFGLPSNAIADKDTLSFRAGNLDQRTGFYNSKELLTEDFEFGFSIKANAYHMIGADIDGLRYTYSRGHWSNTGTAIVVADEIKRFKGKRYAIRDTSKYASLKMRVKSGTLTWYYNGNEMFKTRLKKSDAPPRVSLVIGGHEALVSFRKMRLETDYSITRTHLKDTPTPGRKDAQTIEKLMAATINHNKQILTERKQLQEAILQAEEEQAVVTAKAAYKRQITSIKNTYINELQDVLGKAVEGDRLEVAGKIKTQILRVKKQIINLAKADTEPNVPELDAGEADDPPPGEKPDDADDNQPGDDPPADDASDEGELDFFGLPLE